MKNTSALIFTDLDGTFLDNDNFSYGQNIDYAKNLIKSGHFVIFNSSKTFIEIFELFSSCKINFPIICETGGGIYFPSELANNYQKKINSSYNVIYEAPKISQTVDKIKVICHDFKDEMKFFNDLSHNDKIKISNLDPDGVVLASQRIFSILFTWSSSEERLMKLQKTLEKINIRVIRGARFFHLCSKFDKGTAMVIAMNKFKKIYPDREFISVALGDSSNDYEMLKLADYPCVVKSSGNKNISYSDLSVDTVFSSNPAPNGWRECIDNILNNIGDD